MAATKAIISNSIIPRTLLACVSVSVLLAGAVNLFGTWTPADATNALIVERLSHVSVDAMRQDRTELARLKNLQASTLARKPAEPFAWQRLAWLRLVVDYDRAGALQALKISDSISPYEPRQLVERALLWWRLRDIEDARDKAHLDVLWARAYEMQPTDLLRQALTYNLTADVGDALKKLAPAETGRWDWMVQNPGF